jgi:hypothetical protein
MFNRPKTESPSATVGGDFEKAAEQVSAKPAETEFAENGPAVEVVERFLIREEWAEGAARLCFVPPARLIHPAYALTDDEAERIAPQMQEFLQAVADKYAPAALATLSSKYPEFFDLTAALGVLYYQKWKYVSHLRAVEAREKKARENASPEPFSQTIDADVSRASRTVETDKPQVDGPHVI